MLKDKSNISNQDGWQSVAI